MTREEIPNKCVLFSFLFRNCRQNWGMFTGIIENSGVVERISERGANRVFVVRSSLASELSVDQSLSHNGVCLTVEAIENELYQVTAVAETLEKTDLGSWKVGSIVNLERAMVMNGRLDGHLVQGHVDTTGTCTGVEDQDGSWLFEFSFPEKFAHLVIEKGSIAVNGISLTAWNVKKDRFSVAIIPYTYEHTNLSQVLKGDTVNLEFDMVGKYIHRFQTINQPA